MDALDIPTENVTAAQTQPKETNVGGAFDPVCHFVCDYYRVWVWCPFIDWEPAAAELETRPATTNVSQCELRLASRNSRGVSVSTGRRGCINSSIDISNRGCQEGPRIPKMAPD